MNGCSSTAATPSFHVMQPQIREYYNLEEVWGAKRVNMKIDPEYALPVRKTEKA